MGSSADVKTLNPRNLPAHAYFWLSFVCC